MPDRERPLPCSGPARLQHHDEAGVARRVRVPHRAGVARVTKAAGGYQRWIICALLFFATTINYIDRQVIGILKPTLVQRVRLAGRADLRGHRLHVPARLRHRSPPRRAHHGQARHPARLRPRRRALEHRRHRPRGGGQASVAEAAHDQPRRDHGPVPRAPLGGRRRLRPHAVLPGTGGGRQLPGLDQDRRGVVPQEGAGPRHRHLQLRYQRGRAGDTPRRALGHPSLGLEVGVHPHRPHPASCGWRGGGRAYRSPEEHPRLSPAELEHIRSDPPERITPIPWREAPPPPADLGLRHRQVHDRSRSGGSTSSGSRTSSVAATAST